MLLSKAEQETIVRWDRESETLTVFTHSKSAAKNLIAKGAKVKYTSAEGQATCLEMPKNWFKWPRPKRAGAKRAMPVAALEARKRQILAEKDHQDSNERE